MPPLDGLSGALKKLNVVKKEDVEQEAPKKLKKSTVLYLHRTGTQYQCKDCVMFIPDAERCWIHDPSAVIRSYGTCGLFVKGRPQPNLKPMGSLSKLESSYTEENREGYSCKRCEYFSAEKHDCAKVDKNSPGDDTGQIHADACCNAWEINDENS